MCSLVTWYAQPTLRRSYGVGYVEYCAAVPGWWPRLSPYRDPIDTADATGGDDESRPS